MLTLLCQAFESVVPSEQTTVTLKVVDTSLRLFGPIYPGGAVVYLGELDFHIVSGKSPETSFDTTVYSLSILIIDDLGVKSETPKGEAADPASQRSGAGTSLWKVFF